MAGRRTSKLDRVHTQNLVVTGVLRAATLSVHAIGEGYAEVARTKPRFGVKQVDRFLSNTAINVAKLTPSWARLVIGSRKEIDGLREGRPRDPLRLRGDEPWSLDAANVEDGDEVVAGRTAERLRVRGHREAPRRDSDRHRGDAARGPRLGDQKLYALLSSLGRDYVIRFRGGILIEDAGGTKKPAEQWVPESGRATMIKRARVTNDRAEVLR